jgi:DNA primase
VNNKYKCFNPSHVDEIPSMVYFEHDNHGNYSPRFKCFGCGEIYDIFSAIQTIEQIDFYEAVVRAAEISNCEVKYEDDGTLLKALKEPRQILRCLQTTSLRKVFKYLNGKGVSVEQAKRYGVGIIISYARYFHH